MAALVSIGFLLAIPCLTSVQGYANADATINGHGSTNTHTHTSQVREEKEERHTHAFTHAQTHTFSYLNPEEKAEDSHHTLTGEQYLAYGGRLREAAAESVTLEGVPFDKDQLLAKLEYARPRTLGDSTECRKVDIERLARNMGSDHVALAHTKLYPKDSIDLLAWLLDGVHFASHFPGDEDHTYSKHPDSFIKYLLNSDNPRFEIPKLDYTLGVFNILDGRHRLGFYRYFGIDGPVFVNPPEGTRKIEELGGRPCYVEVEHVSEDPAEVLNVKQSVGPEIFALAKEAVAKNKETALREIPSEINTYPKKVKYKKAVRYLLH